jgi:hypothetical protein
MKMYWKKQYENGDIELHIQEGFEMGNDITVSKNFIGEWGTYCPMSDKEHVATGYEKITTEEAEHLIEIAESETFPIIVNGMGEQREFEILKQNILDEKFETIDEFDVYSRTFRKMREYGHSGTAYTYIDARNGEVNTCWLGSGTQNHPFDSFYEIWLCKLETGDQAIDINTPEMLLDEDEQEDYEENYVDEIDVETYVIEKFGKEELKQRIENLIDVLGIEFNFDYDDITEQIDELYNR